MGAKESFTGVLNALVPPTAVATAAATPPPPPPPPPEARRHRAGARFESKVSDMDMDVMMRVEGYEHKGWLTVGNNVMVRVLTTATRRIIMFTLSLLMSYLYLTYLYLLPSNARSPAKAKKGLL